MIFGRRSNNMLSIDDLKQLQVDETKLIQRKNHKILILDSTNFDKVTMLRELGYKDIDVMKEYKSMEQFLPYDIIFCNIKGIAYDLDPIYQGAALAKQIKETYLNKIVIILNTFEQSLDLKEYYIVVDDIIKKDMSINEFSKEIDKCISRFNNPKYKWLTFKKKLENAHIPTKDIAVFEDYYVKSVLSGKNYEKEIKKYCGNSSVSNQLNKYLPKLLELTVDILELVM